MVNERSDAEEVVKKLSIFMKVEPGPCYETRGPPLLNMRQVEGPICARQEEIEQV